MTLGEWKLKILSRERTVYYIELLLCQVIMASLRQKKDKEDETLNLWGGRTKHWNPKPQKQKRF